MVLLDLLFTTPRFWVLCLVGILLYFINSRRKLYWLSWQLPGPNPALPIIGNCLLLVRDGINNVLPLINSVMGEWSSGVVRIWLGPNLVMFVQEPGVAYQVNHKTLLKSAEYGYLAKPFFKRGLFNTNDIPHWRKSKKLYLLGLSTENLKSFVTVFHQESTRLTGIFRKFSLLEQSVFTGEMLANFTMACVFKCTFDFDIHTMGEAHNYEFIDAIHSLMKHVQRRIIPFYRLDFIYSLTGYKADELKKINVLTSYMKIILKHHRNKQRSNTMEEDNDSLKGKRFLDYLCQEDLGLSEDDIIFQMLTMVMAGVDTLEIEYTALLILLAQNPHIQEKVCEEVVQVLGDDASICPSAEDLNKLEYVERTLKEVLRMFPAGPITARSVDEDIKITTSENKDYVFPAGTTVAILVSNIHNNPLYYPKPTVMDPDRWLPEEVAKRPPFSFLPFLNGPRNCIGGRYAMLQMKTMVATLVRSLEICTSKSCEKFEDIRTVMSMTLQIETSCQVMFRERRKGETPMKDCSAVKLNQRG